MCDDHRVRLRDMSLDDLISWGWSTTLASTGIVLMYWVDLIAGGLLLVLGLAGMHAVRVRFAGALTPVTRRRFRAVRRSHCSLSAPARGEAPRGRGPRPTLTFPATSLVSQHLPRPVHPPRGGRGFCRQCRGTSHDPNQ